MSYTEIFRFNKNGDIESIGETRNSFRGAMAVWCAIEKKYLPPFKPDWAIKLGVAKNKTYYRCHAIGDEIKEIWKLYNSKEISILDNIVLGSTFDNVIVLKKDILAIVQAFRLFDQKVDDINTSLLEQADIIEKEYENDPSLIGICWNQTSVNCDVWLSNRYELDEFDDKEYLPYNINYENDHWDLFEDIKKKEK